MSPQILRAPLRLESGRSYDLDLDLAPDFAYTQAEIVGGSLVYEAAVYVPAGAHGVRVKSLRVRGLVEWQDRMGFRWEGGADTWSRKLWNLAGLMVHGARGCRIDRIEVDACPVGVRFQAASGFALSQGRFRRCWKPIDARYNVEQGITPTSFSVGDVVSADGRLTSDIDTSSASLHRSKTSREAGEHWCGKSGSYVTGEDYEVSGMVQAGDGFALKAAGSRYRIANLHGSHVYLNGTVAEHATQYPGPEYRHLHESRDVVLEDFRLVGSRAAFVNRALLYVVYPFQTELLVRRGVFVRGGPGAQINGAIAAQVNYARVRFEDCDFVGWPDEAAAFERSPAFGVYPAAELTLAGCRFWSA